MCPAELWASFRSQCGTCWVKMLLSYRLQFVPSLFTPEIAAAISTFPYLHPHLHAAPYNPLRRALMPRVRRPGTTALEASPAAAAAATKSTTNACGASTCRDPAAPAGTATFASVAAASDRRCGHPRRRRARSRHRRARSRHRRRRRTGQTTRLPHRTPGPLAGSPRVPRRRTPAQGTSPSALARPVSPTIRRTASTT